MYGLLTHSYVSRAAVLVVLLWSRTCVGEVLLTNSGKKLDVGFAHLQQNMGVTVRQMDAGLSHAQWNNGRGGDIRPHLDVGCCSFIGTGEVG